MSTNGKPPSVEALRDEIRRERAQAHLARARHERQLWESIGPVGFGQGWSDILSPFGFRYDSFGKPWMPLNQGGVGSKADGRNAPFVQSDADLDSMRAVAYWLTTRNDLAIGAASTVQSLTIKQGYTWEAKPAAGFEADPRAAELAAQVQRVIDRDHDANRLSVRERSACWRAVRDGDCFVRHFCQGDGRTVHRFVRAEQVRDPGGLGPHCSFGVECDPHDVETAEAYWVTYDQTNYDRVPAGQISHLKRNVDEEIKRGVSDFYSTGEAFDEVGKLLRGMRRGATLMSKIAWIEKYAKATAGQIQAHSAGLRDLHAPVTEHPLTGRRIDYQHFDDGTIVRTNQERDYESSPLAANTTNFIAVVQACLRAVGTRWGFPEYFISGDASNNNYASILVSGSPLVNRIECQQDDFGAFFLRWRWVAIANACRYGLIRADFETVQALVDVHFTAPQVALSNEQEAAAIDAQDIAAKVMSKAERMRRRNLDPDLMRKEIAQEAKEEAARQPQGGGGAPGGPTEAGGLLGESFTEEDALALLSEARAERKEGEEWETGGRKYKRVGGKTVRIASKKDDAGPKKPGKVSAADVEKALRAAMESGKKATAKDAEALAAAVVGLKADEIKALRQRLGLTKGSGAKQKLADELIAKVVAGGKETKKGAATKAPPAGPPAAPAFDPAKEAAAIERPRYRPGQAIPHAELRGVLAKAANATVRVHLMRQIMDEAQADEPQPVARHGMSTPAPMKTMTVGGLKLLWEEKAGAAAHSISNYLAADPPAALVKSTKSITFTTQRNNKDAFWEKQYNMPGFRSAATGGDFHVVVYSADRYAVGADSINHESGHNLANRIWGSTAPPERSPYGEAQKKEGPVSRYGGASPAEDFAEACMMYADPQEREILRTHFPLKYEALARTMSIDEGKR